MAEAVLENNYQRQLTSERSQSRNSLQGLGGLDKAKKEAFEKVAELALETARRWAVRRIAWAFGATLVGFIVTHLIWTAQFILGNWLKKESVPTLNGLEVGIWAFCTFIMVALLIIVVVLLMLLLLTSLGPVAGLVYVGSMLFNTLKDYIF